MAELETTAEPSTVTAIALADAVRGLGRVAELPALARHAGCPVDAGLVAQVDAVASIAAHLAAILGGQEPEHRVVSGPDHRRAGLGADLAGGLADETGLGPNEMVPSLILAAEVLSLAARVVLVMARLTRSRSRAWLVCGLSRRAICWTARVLPMVVPADVGHPLWFAGLGVVVAIAGQFAPRPIRTLTDVLAGASSAAAPHALVVVAVVATVLTTGGPGRVLRRRLTSPAVSDVDGPGRCRPVGTDCGAQIRENAAERRTERALRNWRLSCRIRRVTG
ncbi:MAG TPA: hypothetical protein VHX38_16765 [Pseudonocardiaceae bacterium]|nr:hypothetical protein [Pseudonocardiaceae bacterium]